MVYAYDNWVQLPTRDIYDTQMMSMAINAARDMYQSGQEEMKDFKKEYGDFITPIQADQDWYNQNVTGRVRSAINQMYAAGIDPLRSAEGRAAIAQMINSIDVGKVAKLKTSAENAKEYIKNRGVLEAAGKYNDDLERRFLGFDMDNWNTLGNGIWNRVSPTEMKTLKELTNDWYNNRTARDLSPEEVGAGYDKRYQYTGFLDSDLLNVARGNTPGWNNSIYSQYYRNLAEQKVAARGEYYTQEDVERQLQRDIADSQQEWLIKPTKQADQYEVMAQKYRYDLDLQNRKAESDAIIAGIKKGVGVEGRYSATTNMAADAEGSMRGQLFNYIDANSASAKEYDKYAESIAKEMEAYKKDPSKYTQQQREELNKKLQNLEYRRESVGLEGVAKSVVSLSKKANTAYFTNRPEDMNDILRDLSSTAASGTLTRLLRELGGSETSNGGTAVNKSRMCGIGEVLTDVLQRGYADGQKHKDIDDAIKELTSGRLSKYQKSYTAGAFDIRNEVDDTNPLFSGESDFWPTGRVVSGNKYYYIEIANDQTDRDECCWFKVERDVMNGGGIHPTISSISQTVDNAYMHDYSNSNVIGNQQGVVAGYNK